MSLCFYGYGEPKFVYVMTLSIFVNWALGIGVDRLRGRLGAKALLALMIVYNIGIFFVYKYLDFAILNIDRFFGVSFTPPGNVLPIGISFFTFQAMSYVIDVYRGTARVQKNPLNTALYIALFPPLIAGPIIRYESIADQITNRSNHFNLMDFTYGSKRFIFGLAKKILLANALGMIADRAFDLPAQNATVLGAWLGIICYTFQIYFDFSGYSDMAIGLGRMFGFRIDENFNYPYIAKSITEFWRRWHISLSSWFRDYVYFPLGGSRVKSKRRLVFNLFITWMLTGVWHGAGWNFIAWGFFYFVLLTIEKLFDIPKKTGRSPVLSVVYRIFTILCFMIGWVIFRAGNLGSAIAYFRTMFGSAPGGQALPLYNETALFFLKDIWLVLVICVIACTPVCKNLWERLTQASSPGIRRTLNIAGDVYRIFLLIACAGFTVIGSYDPFIYFNF
ncbi:alginate O-acetylation protein [Clostridia bacterium]|nr:alginate O-acetylation protein [Clostridia bacterium]